MIRIMRISVWSERMKEGSDEKGSVDVVLGQAENALNSKVVMNDHHKDPDGAISG